MPSLCHSGSSEQRLEKQQLTLLFILFNCLVVLEIVTSVKKINARILRKKLSACN